MPEPPTPPTPPTPPMSGPPEPPGPDATPEQLSLWDSYWERFRRQQVDDPVEDRREGYWDRFKRQQVDDPVPDRLRTSRRREPPPGS